MFILKVELLFKLTLYKTVLLLLLLMIIYRPPEILTLYFPNIFTSAPLLDIKPTLGHQGSVDGGHFDETLQCLRQAQQLTDPTSVAVDPHPPKKPRLSLAADKEVPSCQEKENAGYRPAGSNLSNMILVRPSAHGGKIFMSRPRDRVQQRSSSVIAGAPAPWRPGPRVILENIQNIRGQPPRKISRELGPQAQSFLTPSSHAGRTDDQANPPRVVHLPASPRTTTKISKRNPAGTTSSAASSVTCKNEQGVSNGAALPEAPGPSSGASSSTSSSATTRNEADDRVPVPGFRDERNRFSVPESLSVSKETTPAAKAPAGPSSRVHLISSGNGIHTFFDTEMVSNCYILQDKLVIFCQRIFLIFRCNSQVCTLD
jgi:hypothetical protein